MYGIIARYESAGPGFATPFGRVVLLRAGRFARLDAQGRRAPSNLALAASHFGGLSAGNIHRAGIQTALDGPSGNHNGQHGGVGDPGWPQPLNSTWGNVVALEVEVRNDGTDPVLFSPGQLRLKLSRQDVTVTPQDSDHPPGPVASHANEHILISYLAPHDEAHFEVEYTDHEYETPFRIPLPLRAATGVL